MELFGAVNRILDGVGSLLGSPSALEKDPRVSIAHLRYKRGSGLDSVSASMAEISRPIMRTTLIEVREAKKHQPARVKRPADSFCSA
jgi:hypothetical protein